MDTKQCSKCKETKPLTSDHFYKQKNSPSGFGGYCKPCSKVVNKNWRDTKGKTVFDKLEHSKTHRVCRDCLIAYPNKDMGYRHKKGWRWRSYCSSCGSARTREYNLKRIYGISSDDYESMLEAQNGVCWICQKSEDVKLSVDHDHDTGKVRGLLCNRCNRGIGNFDDEPELLQRAVYYLTKK
jgi:hypothetical protein